MIWLTAMEIEKQEIVSGGIKFLAAEEGNILGRAYLYILKNDQHDEPFGFMEDVFVEESHRSRGVGRLLVEAVIAEAKSQGCYKLVCTARSTKPEVHKYYEKFGFKMWGSEFRMDLKK